MSNDDLVSEVIDRLKGEGFLMIADDFIDQLITTLHANVNTINTMTKIAELQNQLQAGSLPKVDRQVNSLKELSKNIAEIAFNMEDVRNEQR